MATDPNAPLNATIAQNRQNAGLGNASQNQAMISGAVAAQGGVQTYDQWKSSGASAPGGYAGYLSGRMGSSGYTTGADGSLTFTGPGGQQTSTNINALSPDLVSGVKEVTTPPSTTPSTTPTSTPTTPSGGTMNVPAPATAPTSTLASDTSNANAPKVAGGEFVGRSSQDIINALGGVNNMQDYQKMVQDIQSSGGYTPEVQQYANQVGQRLQGTNAPQQPTGGSPALVQPTAPTQTPTTGGAVQAPTPTLAPSTTPAPTAPQTQPQEATGGAAAPAPTPTYTSAAGTVQAGLPSSIFSLLQQYGLGNFDPSNYTQTESSMKSMANMIEGLKTGIADKQYQDFINIANNHQQLYTQSYTRALDQAATQQSLNVQGFQNQANLTVANNNVQQAQLMAEKANQMAIVNNKNAHLEGFLKGSLAAMGVDPASTAGISYISSQTNLAMLNASQIAASYNTPIVELQNSTNNTMANLALNVAKAHADYTADYNNRTDTLNDQLMQLDDKVFSSEQARDNAKTQAVTDWSSQNLQADASRDARVQQWNQIAFNTHQTELTRYQGLWKDYMDASGYVANFDPTNPTEFTLATDQNGGPIRTVMAQYRDNMGMLRTANLTQVPNDAVSAAMHSNKAGLGLYNKLGQIIPGTESIQWNPAMHYYVDQFGQPMALPTKGGTAPMPVGTPLDMTGGGASTAPQTTGGFRTDRNNNPTAFTTDVAAKNMGLVEGKDYVQGDPFTGSDGKTYYTAKILGDPVATTIQGLDNAAAQGAMPKWTHTSITPEQWNGMSDDQKQATVASMYQKEGGSGSLISQDTPTQSADTAGALNLLPGVGTTGKIRNGYLQQATASGQGQEFLDQEQAWQANKKTVADYSTAGATGKNITAFNTVLQHLPVLLEAAQKLQNMPTSYLNSVKNWADADLFGSGDRASFNIAISLIGPELAKAAKGGAGALNEEEVASMKNAFSTSSPPQAFINSVNTAMDLMMGKMRVVTEQYKQATGNDRNFIVPASASEIQKIGYDPTTFNKVGFPVKAPDGQTYYFKDQVMADKFNSQVSNTSASTNYNISNTSWQ